MNHITLIADIINSKQIPERKDFQRKLIQTLKEITDRSPSIVSPYTVTLGDEFQAVYKTPATLFLDILNILKTAHPYGIRFSIGIDTIETDLNYNEAIGMDGPAFHIARDGLEELKSYKYSIVQFYGKISPNHKILNSSLQYIMAIMSSWKLNTFQIFTEILQGKKVREIALKMVITERAVYKTVKTHHLHELSNYLKALNLEKILGEDR